MPADRMFVTRDQIKKAFADISEADKKQAFFSFDTKRLARVSELAAS